MQHSLRLIKICHFMAYFLTVVKKTAQPIKAAQLYYLKKYLFIVFNKQCSVLSGRHALFFTEHPVKARYALEA